jgi:hypothetical protein
MSIPRKYRHAFVSKQHRKRVEGACRICGEDNYSLLDVHRIVPGSRYSYHGVTIICCACHRREQSGEIQILGWVHSTAGRLLHIIDENGAEQFL